MRWAAWLGVVVTVVVGGVVAWELTGTYSVHQPIPEDINEPGDWSRVPEPVNRLAAVVVLTLGLGAAGGLWFVALPMEKRARLRARVRTALRGAERVRVAGVVVAVVAGLFVVALVAEGFDQAEAECGGPFHADPCPEWVVPSLRPYCVAWDANATCTTWRNPWGEASP